MREMYRGERRGREMMRDMCREEGRGGEGR